ncbi:hypothetical protein SARC_08437 [Sphaeroforma arctica JP610]|uniref:Integrase zinc-binding domain-containing protein n=1 Tax=Sphaeroforma arctica JP610 TaxID=667725 RepID=A0A0L0FQT4_9EUKA|nr:hypothetical protein SARC_08437 [Sphaeroforma arctica JP610]KNC79157.1 hypothetical protein SARC_08437 [Sphaeroforma arctica JP610]|eukprot:XP_014153059.1 hypothetical protein SARC_08437 [Sphaeroforma arctica JP610]
MEEDPVDEPLEDVKRDRLQSMKRSVFGFGVGGTIIERIVRYTHELFAHASAKRLDQLTRTLWGWSGMMEMCTHVRQSCDACQAISDDLGKEKGLLHVSYTVYVYNILFT